MATRGTPIKRTKKMEEVKSVKKKKDLKKYVCFKCEQEMDDSNFYNSYSKAHKLIPICKDCFKKLFDEYTEDNNSSSRALWKMCSMFDIYYSQIIVDSTLDRSKKENWQNQRIIGDYMRVINSSPQYKNLTFYNSDESTLHAQIENIPTDSSMEVYEKEWGFGYTSKDYERLSDIYTEWKNGTVVSSVTQISLTRDLCKVCLQIEKAIAKNENTKDLMMQKSNLIKQLAIDPASLQKFKQEESANQCWGMEIKDIEETTVAEYIENQKMYRDVNGIEKYFKIHVKRPFLNLALGHKDYPDIVGEEIKYGKE